MKNEILIAARKQSGKTQNQVAAEIGIAEVAYQRYEYGSGVNTIKTAIRIAKSLGTTVEKLWDNTNQERAGLSDKPSR